MINLDSLASALVALAGVLSLFASRPVQRAGLVFMVANYVAFWAQLTFADWQMLLALNIAAMYFTAKAPPTPATVTQMAMASGYLVSGLICAAFAMSWQTNHALWVAYHKSTAITIVQALWLMGVSGGMLANRIRKRAIDFGPRLAGFARKAIR